MIYLLNFFLFLETPVFYVHTNTARDYVTYDVIHISQERNSFADQKDNVVFCNSNFCQVTK